MACVYGVMRGEIGEPFLRKLVVRTEPLLALAMSPTPSGYYHVPTLVVSG